MAIVMGVAAAVLRGTLLDPLLMIIALIGMPIGGFYGQAQECLHGKWFRKVGEWTKLAEAAWADTYSGDHHNGEFLLLLHV